MGSTIRTTRLPSGEDVPVLGQGTWNMGEDRGRRADEVAALRLGIDLGMTLIDTAEMYAQRRRRRGRRRGDRAAGATRSSSSARCCRSNATARGTVAGLRAQPEAARHRPHRSLPAALARRRAAGGDARRRSRRCSERARSATGASAISTPTTWRSSAACPAATRVATNQVLYNLTRRGIEYDLLPVVPASGVPIMAYSPVEQGRLLDQ